MEFIDFWKLFLKKNMHFTMFGWLSSFNSDISRIIAHGIPSLIDSSLALLSATISSVSRIFKKKKKNKVKRI